MEIKKLYDRFIGYILSIFIVIALAIILAVASINLFNIFGEHKTVYYYLNGLVNTSNQDIDENGITTYRSNNRIISIMSIEYYKEHESNNANNNEENK